MEKTIILSIGITILFCIFKFLEMKYINKEIKPLQFFVRDAVLIFVASLICSNILFQFDHQLTDFFAVVTDSKILVPETTQVFTGVPDF